MRLLLVFMLGALSLLGQVLRTGLLEGEIRDRAGAVVPNAPVVATHTETGVHYPGATNETGLYQISYLPAGTYALTVDVPGFKGISRTVTIALGRTTTVNLELEIGNVNQRVEVSADATLLETNTSSSSVSMNNRYVAKLPVVGGNVFQQATLSAGLTQGDYPTAQIIAHNKSVSRLSANGARNQQNAFLMDGIPNNRAELVAYVPPVEQVQEFNVQTNSFDAEFGNGGGAIISVITKSGTNQLHGALYEYNRNEVFNANTFFNNRSGAPRPRVRFNRFGAAVGGPVLRNRTFWFFNYEGMRQSSPTSSTFTIPTLAQQAGDFSRTFDSRGRLIEIYDPSTTRTDPANPNKFVRTLFPGNVIPSARINKVSGNLLSRFLPSANLPGNALTGTNNVLFNGAEGRKLANFTTRFDHNIGSRHRLFGRWGRTESSETAPYVMPAFGLKTERIIQISTGGGDTYMLRPDTIVTLNAGLTRYIIRQERPGFDMPALGFSNNFAGTVQAQTVPLFSNSDMAQMGVGDGNSYDVVNTYTYSGTVSHLRGRHSLRLGFNSLIRQWNSASGSAQAGSFSFDRGFTQGSDPTAPASNVGHGVASLLLGSPSSGSVAFRNSQASQAPYYSLFFQDDFRMTTRLTLNLGLRYEVSIAPTERYNRATRGYAFDTANPIEAAARANYAANPIDQLPASAFNVRGGLQFASSSDRRTRSTPLGDVSPRLGLAYTLNNKTVLRAGYGHFYSYWAGAGSVYQDGFASTTPMLATVDGLTPAGSIENPYPQGLSLPIGSSQGLQTLLGNSLSVLSVNSPSTYNARWQASVQRELQSDWRLEAAYVGSRAINQFVGNSGSGGAGEQQRRLNFIPEKYLSLGSVLNQQVANPFFGLIPSNLTLGQAKISRQNLLMAYPHLSQLTLVQDGSGSSVYHSGQFTLTKRFAHGLQALTTYTFQRQIDNSQYLNDSDPAPSKAVAEYWRRHRVSFAGVGDLPFGKGRRFANINGFAGALVNGWQLSVMYIFQSGAPIYLPSGSLATGQDPRLSAGDRTLNRWFNTGAFTVQPSFTLRSLSVRSASLIGDALSKMDLSLSKSTTIAERFSVEFRAEAFNATNRVQFGNPDVNPASAAYGTVNSQVSVPREIQLGLRIGF
ncbi:TonB-dependent receptor [uncultured Paludibaculum sp.]|uniref:TonB-dependent receptor n=1 Tax=uncultured Paludibaculum sp. TaxID=1765020 RepID=UPI002AABB0C6|nr:TonB-dependent receptor [uncultured Paludibaculum sp.]